MIFVFLYLTTLLRVTYFKSIHVAASSMILFFFMAE